jgi:hypothetical protein
VWSWEITSTGLVCTCFSPVSLSVVACVVCVCVFVFVCGLHAVYWVYLMLRDCVYIVDFDCLELHVLAHSSRQQEGCDTRKGQGCEQSQRGSDASKSKGQGCEQSQRGKDVGTPKGKAVSITEQTQGQGCEQAQRSKAVSKRGAMLCEQSAKSKAVCASARSTAV